MTVALEALRHELAKAEAFNQACEEEIEAKVAELTAASEAVKYARTRQGEAIKDVWALRGAIETLEKEPRDSFTVMAQVLKR